MKHLSLLAFSLLLWGCHSSTEQKNLKSYTAEQLYNNKSIGGARFNGDESRVLVNANNTGIFNIYSIAVADTVMKPLTNSTKDSYFAVGYVAGSDNFLYVADQGGNENYHIYLQKQNAVTAKDITPWDGRKNSVVGWSDDKKHLYISSNKRDVKFYDIYKLDTATWSPELFYRNDGDYSA